MAHNLGMTETSRISSPMRPGIYSFNVLYLHKSYYVGGCLLCPWSGPALKNPGVNKRGVTPGQRTQTLSENKLLETFLLKKKSSFKGVIASAKAYAVNHSLF